MKDSNNSLVEILALCLGLFLKWISLLHSSRMVMCSQVIITINNKNIIYLMSELGSDFRFCLIGERFSRQSIPLSGSRRGRRCRCLLISIGYLSYSVTYFYWSFCFFNLLKHYYILNVLLYFAFFVFCIGVCCEFLKLSLMFVTTTLLQYYPY